MISTVLAFIVTLAVLIVVHEYGHYRMARACGVRVLRFSVGFGRVVFRRQKNADATEFVVSMLPFGGYVRMLDEREAPVPPDQLHEAFNRKPLPQRALIVAAGPAANLLLAVVLYAVVYWVGMQEPQPVLSSPAAGSLAEAAGLRSQDRVLAVADADGQWQDIVSLNELRWQISQAVLEGRALRLQVAAPGSGSRSLLLPVDTLESREIDDATLRRIGLGVPYGEPLMGAVQPDGPAARAGLMQGDRVLEVDGSALSDAQQLRERIRGVKPGATMQWLVERNGRSMQVEVTPRIAVDAGRQIGRIDAYLGSPPAMVLVRLGPLEGLTSGAAKTWDMARLSVQMLGRMLIGEASIRNLSGPLTIADYAGQSVQQGLTYYIGFLALISVSLGVLNLLPLPMLDGGHLMYYLFEGVTGHPVSDLWLKWLQRGGAFVLLLLMSLALSNDVARLLGLQ